MLESVNKQDATYLWRVDVSEADARKNRSKLRTAFIEVDEAISQIRAEGRNLYKKEAPEHFCYIEHDYQSDDGFLAWKNALHRVLDGED